MLEVKTSKVQHAQRGSLGAEVRDGALYVPQDVARTIQEMGLLNAEKVLSAIDSFPSSWVALLGWEMAEVQEARGGLRKLLTGHIDDAFINPPPPTKRSYGAMIPPGIAPEKLRGPPLPPDAPFGK